MSGRTWPRLRVFEVPARSDREKLKALVTRLRSDAELSVSDRRDAASYLNRLALNESALAALNTGPGGRPRSPDAPDIALDYLVRKELLGKAEAAWHDTADAWCVSVGTVKDAYGDWKEAAKFRLAELADSRVGRLRLSRKQPDGSVVEYLWTRRELLEAVRDDLQDIRRQQPIRKGRRKRSGKLPIVSPTRKTLGLATRK